MYHHDYLFTSVILMVVHSVLCVLPPLLAPHAICNGDRYAYAANNEQFYRWLLLSIFASVPLLIDVIFDHFKSTASAVERNQWLARIIVLIALLVPGCAIALSNFYFEASAFQQCRLVSSIVPAQTMILVSSIFCTMFRQHTYVASDEEEKKSKFSIEKRALAFMAHATTSRAVMFIYYAGSLGKAFAIVVVIVNAVLMIHFIVLLFRYLFILLSGRVNGEFTSPQALSDFLYTTACLVFLFGGLLIATLLQAAGVTNGPPDLASTTLGVPRLVSTVCFTLFITVIPGRVGTFAAKLEHQKLQTRLNLIRYVSHEMRSPLNTAFLGLEFVTGELSRMHMENLAAAQMHNRSMYKAVSQADLEMGQMPRHAVSKDHLHGASATSPADYSEISNVVPYSGDSERSTVNGGQPTRTAISDVLDIVKQINASCNIALYTLNDLLTFDKLDEKKLEVELQPVNPWHFALDTAKPFKINAKESQVDFTISCEQYETKWYRSHQLRADEFKLSQVLRNLISNAVKFTPKKGRVHMKVEMIPNYASSNILIMGSTLGHLVRISVTDTGPGISAQNLHKLFGQYVQFNPSKLQKGGGSGLGLWISKSKSQPVCAVDVSITC
jgi:signal transduction histidine kinase